MGRSKSSKIGEESFKKTFYENFGFYFVGFHPPRYDGSPSCHLERKNSEGILKSKDLVNFLEESSR